MLLLAVKSVLVASQIASGGQLAPSEQSAWTLVSKKIAVVNTAGQPSGIAVSINEGGRYLTHRSSVGPGSLTITLQDGRSFTAKLTSNDVVTGLALIEADLNETGQANSDSVLRLDNKTFAAKSNLKATQLTAGVRLIVVSLEGPIRAELNSSQRIGISGSSRRGMTLSEIRFETPSRPNSGALAFSLDGRLVGVLGATLDNSPATTNQAIPPHAAALKSPGGIGGGLSGSANNPILAEIYGPQGLTVAYSITADILNRVIEGFCSESRTVKHPAMGLLVQDGPEGGIKIVSVVKGSNAEKAGLKAGDEVMTIGDTRMESQFDYTRFLVKQKVGDVLPIKYKRNGSLLETTITVGSS